MLWAMPPHILLYSHSSRRFFAIRMYPNFILFIRVVYIYWHSDLFTILRLGKIIALGLLSWMQGPQSETVSFSLVFTRLEHDTSTTNSTIYYRNCSHKFQIRSLPKRLIVVVAFSATAITSASRYGTT